MPMAAYDRTRFRASHNSYSGGDRGSLQEQLNANVRCVEFDFHDNDFTQFNDYRVGHLKPGAEVDLTPPNPADTLLGSWMAAVVEWADAHPGHDPITIVLDAKDDLTDNAEGDLEDLNERLHVWCGARLFTREAFDQLGGWPDLAVLRGKILCVLSGNGGSRAAYRWAFGTTPAVGVNKDGRVVLSYRTLAGELNYWTGVVQDGAVAWRRKNVLAVTDVDVAEPAIRINDDGWVVAAYRFGPRRQTHGLMLANKLGRLQGDGRVKWFDAQVLGAGRTPSLEIDGDNIELIYKAETGAKRLFVTGVIDRTSRKIKWKKPKDTQRALFPRDVAERDAHQVRVSVDDLGAVQSSVGRRPSSPVRFRQVLFVERQGGEDPSAFRDAPFFGAGAANQQEIGDARRLGLVARAWGFGEVDKTQPPTSPQENFPATDTPHTVWYQNYV